MIQDEVLASRLGLVPITASKAGLDGMTWFQKPAEGEPPVVNDLNTLVFRLQAECTRKAGVSKDEDDPKKLYNNAHIYARDMVWCPTPGQAERFSEGIPRPVNPDILLVKLRPGQQLEIEMHAIKGIGADHAKFSPVATASYRLLPAIDIIKPIIGEDAKKFARCFPKGVIGLENITDKDAAEDKEYTGHVGEKKAVVKDTFRDTVSRECLRHDEFTGKVKLGRVKDHFIFNVESTGQYESDELFLMSLKVLKGKCSDIRRDLTSYIK